MYVYLFATFILVNLEKYDASLKGVSDERDGKMKIGKYIAKIWNKHSLRIRK